MGKEVSKEKKLKRLNDQLKNHSENPKMVAKLKSRIQTVQKSK
jgi:hypothetical protein